MVVRRFLLIVSAVAVAVAFAHPIEIKNLGELRTKLGVTDYDNLPDVKFRMKSVKVAILDKGFGKSTTLDKDLPPSVFKLNATYDAALINKYSLGSATEQKPLEEEDDHGRVMALSVWGVTGFSTSQAPEIHLLNSNGFTNFTRAVHYCIEHGINIILFSQNWEYGGKFDGRGFINKVVSKATDAGIIWVNAVGNYGRRVHNATYVAGTDGFARLGKSGIGLLVKSTLDRNPFKAVLSWDQYTDEETSGTDKDLDLFVYDETGTEVFKSEMRQVARKDGVERAEGQTYVAREIVEGMVGRGNYYIRVKAHSANFDSFDRMRITVLSQRGPYFDAAENSIVDPLEFLDATEGGEIMIPADHPKVIAVGERAQISALGPTSDGRSKPDVVIDSSTVEMTDGNGSSGTSNAAALFAGVLTVLKAHQPDLTTADVLRFTKRERVTAAKITSDRTGIQDLGVDNFKKAQPSVVAAIEGILGRNTVSLGGQRPNGLYIAAIDRSPFQLSRFFRLMPSVYTDMKGYEVYLAETTDTDGMRRVRAFWRNADRSVVSGPTGWEQVLQQSPQRFVQVVQASRVQEGTLPVIPVWTTPKPEKLLTPQAK